MIALIKAEGSLTCQLQAARIAHEIIAVTTAAFIMSVRLAAGSWVSKCGNGPRKSTFLSFVASYRRDQSTALRVRMQAHEGLQNKRISCIAAWGALLASRLTLSIFLEGNLRITREQMGPKTAGKTQAAHRRATRKILCRF